MSWHDPEIAAVRALLLARRPAPGQPAPSFAERRAAMDANGDMGALPSGLFHEPMMAGGVKCERVVPAGAKPERTLMHLHGGGYCLGSPRSHRPMIARLAEASSATAIAVDYRLGPENRFPCAVDDALETYRHLLRHGVEPGGLIVSGDSAGGGLALALALSLKEKGLPQPAGYVLMSPWADLTQSHETFRTKAESDPFISKAALDSLAQAYLGALDPRDPLASPVLGDLSDLPPILVQVGSEEVLLGDSLRLAEVAGQARVEVTLEIWPEMIHVFQAFGGQLAAARRAIASAGRWMDARFGR